MQFTVNDLFCGCGGMGLGFKNANFNIVGAWDFNKYAVQAYKENVGSHVELMDINDMSYGDLPRANVWTFGFPCVDLSYAGRMAGIFEGKRSGLFFQVMRLLEETELNNKENLPEVILAENVKGLKPYLHVLEEEYEKRGYRMFYALLNSRYWNVAQNRLRYFVVGVRKDISADFEFPKEVQVDSVQLADVLEVDLPEKLYHPQDKTDALLSRVDIPEGTLAGCSMRTRSYRGQAQQLEVRKDNVSNTITTVYKDFLFVERPHGSDVTRVRRPSVRETARLQGFPNSYKVVVSDSQAYTQFGNAVTVNVAFAIATEIGNFLAKNLQASEV